MRVSESVCVCACVFAARRPVVQCNKSAAEGASVQPIFLARWDYSAQWGARRAISCGGRRSAASGVVDVAKVPLQVRAFSPPSLRASSNGRGARGGPAPKVFPRVRLVTAPSPTACRRELPWYGSLLRRAGAGEGETRAPLICAACARASISHAARVCVRACARVCACACARACRCDVVRPRRSMCTRVCVGASVFFCQGARARVRACARERVCARSWARVIARLCVPASARSCVRVFAVRARERACVRAPQCV